MIARIEYLIGLVNVAWLTSLFSVDFTQKVIILVLQIIFTFLTRWGFERAKKVRHKRKELQNEIVTNNIRTNKKGD